MFIEQVVKDALCDAQKNNAVRFDDYTMFVIGVVLIHSSTLSQADTRYAFLERVYASVAFVEGNDVVESGGEETPSNDTEAKVSEGKGEECDRDRKEV